MRPSTAERDEINRIIMDELVCGVFKPEAVAYFQRVIARMKERGLRRRRARLHRDPADHGRRELAAADARFDTRCSRARRCIVPLASRSEEQNQCCRARQGFCVAPHTVVFAKLLYRIVRRSLWITIRKLWNANPYSSFPIQLLYSRTLKL